MSHSTHGRPFIQIGVLGITLAVLGACTATSKISKSPFTMEQTPTSTSGGFSSLAHCLGAKDYRVYVLPQPRDIQVDGTGQILGIQNAVYRCAGRQALREPRSSRRWP